MATLPLHNDLADLVRQALKDSGTGGATSGFMRVALNRSVVDFARAVLSRWGRPAPTPSVEK